MRLRKASKLQSSLVASLVIFIISSFGLQESFITYAAGASKCAPDSVTGVYPKILSGCIFQNMSFANDNFEGHVFIKSKFSNVDLTNVSFSGDDMSGARFFGITNGSSINFKKTVLNGATLDGDFSKSDFSYAHLKSSQLNGNFTGSNFLNADLSSAVFSSSVDSISNFVTYSDLTNANFKNSNLRSSTLLEVILTNCNMSTADLTNATASYITKYAGVKLPSGWIVSKGSLIAPVQLPSFVKAKTYKASFPTKKFPFSVWQDSISTVSCSSSSFCLAKDVLGEYYIYNGKVWADGGFNPALNTCSGGTCQGSQASWSPTFFCYWNNNCYSITASLWFINGHWIKHQNPLSQELKSLIKVVNKKDDGRCISIRFCFLESFNDHGLAHASVYDGKKWTSVPTIAQQGKQSFQSYQNVSCASTSFCITENIGLSFYDGKKWSKWINGFNSWGSSSQENDPISCAPINFCVVGNFPNSGDLTTFSIK